MGYITFNGSNVGTQLNELLMSEAITPGASAGYQLCKNIYLYHPLGAKMVEFPIDMALSKPREITVKDSPEEMVVDQFRKTWDKMQCDSHIKNLAKTSRIYGIASIAYMCEGVESDVPIPLNQLKDKKITFNVFDPLNTSGSLVLSQNPLSPDFQKPAIVAIGGQKFHPSRTCVMLNEEPIYVSYTQSAFGFVGRSVYQRALFPLKTFIQTMITDDLVTKKAGVLVAKIKSAGSFIDNIMQAANAFKRNIINEAEAGNSINIDVDEDISTLDMQNIDKSMTTARRNCLENIAMADSMPAKILNSETFAEGFGEGTEDAKNVARYVDSKRSDLQPIFNWFDEIVMHCAWTPEFFESVKNEHPDMYDGTEFNQAFMAWKNSFRAVWQNFLIEPDSEKVKTEEVKLKAIISMLEKLLDQLDPDNKSALIQWAMDNFNEQQLLFKSPLTLDADMLLKHLYEQRDAAPQDISSEGGL